MKKLTALLLTLAMALSLAACGGNESNSDGEEKMNLLVGEDLNPEDKFISSQIIDAIIVGILVTIAMSKGKF